MILVRHAEALYWAGRQLERSEHTTRALDVVARDTAHFGMPRGLDEWETLLDVFGLADVAIGGVDLSGYVWELLLDMLGLADGFRATGADIDRVPVADFLFADAANPGSVLSSVRQMRENVRAVRDRVPVELWEQVNRLHLDLDAVDTSQLLREGPYELFSSVRRSCEAIAGVVAEAMPRDEGYTFFDSGRMIERSILTCRVIRCGLLSPKRGFDPAVVLRLSSSLQAYRRMVGYDDSRSALAAFLLRAEPVPRSVLSCLRRVDRHLDALQAQAPVTAPARRACGRIRSLLEFGDMERSLSDDPAGYLLEVEAGVTDLGDTIAAHAFNPVGSFGLHAQFVRPGSGEP